MKRQFRLPLLTLLLLVGYLGWYLWSNWGLITIHADNQALSEVIRSIEKQGRVTIKTNMDPATKVTLNLEKVALAEALESLSVVADARWRLTYFIAPDRSAISAVLAEIASGKRPEGWKTHYVPMPPVGLEAPEVLPDPRKDLWEVSPVQEGTLQAYLQQASRHVSASFQVPESYNPAVASAPSGGPIRKSLAKLVSTAKGSYEEVFLLQGDRRERTEEGERRRGDDGPRFAGNFGDGPGPGRGSGGGGGFDRSATDERIQNELKKLPEAERVVAQQEYEERKKAFEEIRNMTPEQREQAFQNMMNDPRAEERMEKAMSAREARRSPQQRVERGQRYRDRKQQAQTRQQ